MLAAIIANLQNVNPPGPTPRPPMIKIDRGGAGPSWPGYDIVDIMGALRSFREQPGEHPVARAARRHHHIGAFLQQTRERQQQENREGAAFLAGAALAQSAAEEIIQVKDDEIARWIAAYDGLRADLAAIIAPPPTPGRRARGSHRTGASGFGIGGVLLGVTAGVLIGVALARRA